MLKVALSDYLRFGTQLLSGYRYQGELGIAKQREKDIDQFASYHALRRVLDLANGRLRPQSYILAQQGFEVFGADLENGKDSGTAGLLYTAVRRIYQYQAGLSNQQKNHVLRLIRGDVDALPFPSNTFDMVTSVAAMEHFLNVEQVLAEIQRILKPGGFAWFIVHLFPGLSGGHNVRLMQIPLRDLPQGVEPWDHLRSRKIPFRVPLNEWRVGQYRDALARKFVILKDYCALEEGAGFLTPDIEAELSDYSREELLCAARTFLVRKPAG